MFGKVFGLGSNNNIQGITQKTPAQTAPARQYQNLSPLKEDTYSFTKTKSAEERRKEADVAILKRYLHDHSEEIDSRKLNVEKMNQRNLNKWCEKQIRQIEQQNFSNDDSKVEKERKRILEDWFDYAYIMRETGECSKAEALLMLDSITGGLSYYGNELPPVLDKDILFEAMKEMTPENMKKLGHSNTQYAYYDFNDNYRLLLDMQTQRTEQAKRNSAEWEIFLIKDFIEQSDTTTLYKCFGIGVEENEDGTLTLSEYCQPKPGFPGHGFTYKELGIDEEKLFENVREIKGDANFENSNIKKFKNLKSIGGNARFGKSNIENLGPLETIEGNADFQYAYGIKDLNNLKKIGGSIIFTNSNVENTGSLNEIGEYAVIYRTKFTKDDFKNVKVGKGFVKYKTAV